MSQDVDSMCADDAKIIIILASSAHILAGMLEDWHNENSD